MESKLDTQPTKKITKKEIMQKLRETEEQAAKTMTYESIVQNIANAKKARSVILADISGLQKKLMEQDQLILKMNRIMGFKKKASGA